LHLRDSFGADECATLFRTVPQDFQDKKRQVGIVNRDATIKFHRTRETIGAMANQLTLQCAGCKDLVPHTVKAPNHIMHLLISLLTAGIWLVGWLAVVMMPSNAKCARCGRERAAK
jgi:hypothetical protein